MGTEAATPHNRIDMKVPNCLLNREGSAYWLPLRALVEIITRYFLLDGFGRASAEVPNMLHAFAILKIGFRRIYNSLKGLIKRRNY
jgi:hypothetical protein